MVTFVQPPMSLTEKRNIRSLLKWVCWVLIVQVVLVNTSAAIYAYKFTHYYEGSPDPSPGSGNILVKTWKLFSGPSFYKPAAEPLPPFPHETVLLQLDNGQK